MALTREAVRSVADLARLELSPGEEERFAAQLGGIVESIEQLDRYATSAVGTGIGDKAVRADLPSTGLPIGRMLANAPASYDRFVTVPQVLAVDD